MAYKESTRDYSGDARAALQYTLNALPIGAGDRPKDYFTSFGVLIPAEVTQRTQMVAAGALDRMMLSSVSDLDDIRRAAFFAQKYGCGNCYEHACVAYMFLHTGNVRPIALIGRTNHAFVMVGNDLRTDFSDPATYPHNAWICDAWKKIYYPARQYLAHEEERPVPVLIELD